MIRTVWDHKVYKTKKEGEATEVLGRRGWRIAQLVKCMSRKHEDLCSITRSHI